MLIKTHELPTSVNKLFIVPNPEIMKKKRAGLNYQWMIKRGMENVNLSIDGYAPPGAAYHSAMAGKPLNLPELKKMSLQCDDKIILHDYQVPVFEKIKDVRCALIDANTGYGKSVLASKLIAYTKCKTLIVCHNSILAAQFAKEVEKFLGINCGKFFGKEKNLQPVTSTTYASAKLHFDKFQEYGFDMLIIDEVDLFATSACLSFLYKFNSVRKFGFTGTPKRQEYDELIPKNQMRFMNRIWGYHVIGRSEKQLDVLDKIVVKEYEKTYVDEFRIPFTSKEWIKFREQLDEDENRKEQQMKWILDNSNEMDYCLVLLDRVADVDLYFQDIGFYRPKTFKLHGKMKKKEREEMEEKFKKYGGIMIANSSIASRGWDVPEVNKAFLCSPMKGENPVRQAIGRAIRFIKNKKSTLYDWRDSSLAKQGKIRNKIYKEYFKNAQIINKNE